MLTAFEADFARSRFHRSEYMNALMTKTAQLCYHKTT